MHWLILLFEDRPRQCFHRRGREICFVSESMETSVGIEEDFNG